MVWKKGSARQKVAPEGLCPMRKCRTVHLGGGDLAEPRVRSQSWVLLPTCPRVTDLLPLVPKTQGKVAQERCQNHPRTAERQRSHKSICIKIHIYVC